MRPRLRYIYFTHIVWGKCSVSWCWSKWYTNLPLRSIYRGCAIRIKLLEWYALIWILQCSVSQWALIQIWELFSFQNEMKTRTTDQWSSESVNESKRVTSSFIVFISQVQGSQMVTHKFATNCASPLSSFFCHSKYNGAVRQYAPCIVNRSFHFLSIILTKIWHC